MTYNLEVNGEPCECDICLRGRRFEAIVDKLPVADHAFMHDIFALLENAENDAVWYRCQLDELRDAQRIEARSDETPQEARPEGREPDPAGDAHKHHPDCRVWIVGECDCDAP